MHGQVGSRGVNKLGDMGIGMPATGIQRLIQHLREELDARLRVGSGRLGNFSSSRCDIRDVTEVDDAELVRRSGDEPDVFAGLYERHSPAVHRYVAWRVGMPAAEDIAAEVFVRAFRGRERCRFDHGSALPWLLGVASHVIADHRRVEKRRLQMIERLARIEPEPGEQRDVTLSPQLAQALRRMPSAYRDALLLVAWGELSYEEAATALDVSVGTVRSRIFRARRHLTESLGSDHWRGQPASCGVGDCVSFRLDGDVDV